MDALKLHEFCGDGVDEAPNDLPELLGRSRTIDWACVEPFLKLPDDSLQPVAQRNDDNLLTFPLIQHDVAVTASSHSCELGVAHPARSPGAQVVMPLDGEQYLRKGRFGSTIGRGPIINFGQVNLLCRLATPGVN